ncbi:MAG: hypothetical protein Q8L35_02270 [Actinomycetota bacterium]|nr:hypothetical protein [Actinomycetota bacterium]
MTNQQTSSKKAYYQDHQFVILQWVFGIAIFLLWIKRAVFGVPWQVNQFSLFHRVIGNDAGEFMASTLLAFFCVAFVLWGVNKNAWREGANPETDLNFWFRFMQVMFVVVIFAAGAQAISALRFNEPIVGMASLSVFRIAIGIYGFFLAQQLIKTVRNNGVDELMIKSRS